MTSSLDGSIAELVWLLPLLPLLGALVNGVIAFRSHGTPGAVTVGGGNKALVSTVASGVMLLAFALACAIFIKIAGSELSAPFVRNYASWMPVGTLSIDWGIQLDQLSMLMTLVITGVGALIHLFSIGYMKADAGYARYFAYLNLFVAFMLVLVLGSSYAVVFVGWEGVGLCSYLLIGFWFSERANVEAGKKAFIVNRIGDFGFLVAMFLLWANAGTLDFVGAHSSLGGLSSSLLVAIALFFFLGCAGKSAQLPLYMWLPDAMAGPTPVSALIHAATMVTAGVYLIARASPIFSAAPSASLVVASVGALTALFAATIALRQWDIKRVLAYSTVSQLGYMFVAVGAGAYTAGVFHLVTHAFFKAVLFLGAGSVIHSLHHAYDQTHRHDDAQDMRNMGGLRKFMPATAAAMGVATLAIAGIPPFSGFFSKDEILSSVFARAGGSPLASASVLGIPGNTILYAIYVMGLLTALLTAVYMTRLMVLTFAGSNRTGDKEEDALHEAPAVMTVPVLILGTLALVGGWLNLPEILPIGPIGLLEHWLEPVVGSSTLVLAGSSALSHNTELILVAVAVAVAVVGMGYGAFRYRGVIADKSGSPQDTGVAGILNRAYGVDAAVSGIIVRPLNAFADIVLSRGVERGVDRGFSYSGGLFARAARLVGRRIQDGDVGKYAWLVAAGAVAMLAAFTLQ